MKIKIRNALIAVTLFGLGYGFHSVPVRADTNWSYDILQELQTIESTLRGGTGTAQIYKVSTSIGYDHTLRDGYTTIAGVVKGFGCDKDGCYVVVQ